MSSIRIEESLNFEIPTEENVTTETEVDYVEFFLIFCIAATTIRYFAQYLYNRYKKKNK